MKVNEEVEITLNIPKLRVFAGHPAAVPMFITADDLAGVAGAELAAVDISRATQWRWHTEPHVHNRDEIYLSVEANRAVAIDVELAGKVVCLESPFAVRIPAGLAHRFRVRRCPARPSFLFGLFPFNGLTKRKGDYNETAV